MLQNSKYPDAYTHRDLKERLYYEIISYFEKGKVSGQVLRAQCNVYIRKYSLIFTGCRSAAGFNTK